MNTKKQQNFIIFIVLVAIGFLAPLGISFIRNRLFEVIGFTEDAMRVSSLINVVQYFVAILINGFIFFMLHRIAKKPNIYLIYFALTAIASFVSMMTPLVTLMVYRYLPDSYNLFSYLGFAVNIGLTILVTVIVIVLLYKNVPYSNERQIFTLYIFTVFFATLLGNISGLYLWRIGTVIIITIISTSMLVIRSIIPIFLIYLYFLHQKNLEEEDYTSQDPEFQ